MVAVHKAAPVFYVVVVAVRVADVAAVAAQDEVEVFWVEGLERMDVAR